MTTRDHGYNPNAPVTVLIDDKPVTTTKNNANDDFQIPVSVPNLEIDNHTVTVQCGPTLTTIPAVVVSVSAPNGTPTIAATLMFFLVILLLLLRLNRVTRR